MNTYYGTNQPINMFGGTSGTVPFGSTTFGHRGGRGGQQGNLFGSGLSATGGGLFGGIPPPPSPPALPSSNPPAMVQMSSEVETSNLCHVNFFVKKKVTILSNSQPVRIPVSNFSLPASIFCYIAPEASPRCFVLAMITNTSEYPIMKSDICSVLVDGAYVSKTTTNSVNLGETFYLFMGVDTDVKASETGPRKVDHESGLIYRNNVRVFRQKTFIQNNGKQEKRLFVERSVPRSTDSKIQVKMLPSTQFQNQIEINHGQNKELLAKEAKDFPTDGQYYFNKGTNCYIFVKVLGPQQSEEMQIEYQVEHPSGTQIAKV
eukprot:GHVP01017542.1.p1 GENE.GHVP01017542.1~~GHVP01017542.1.p1  ORF type:complete len:318 (-),score=47.10 GHVP01017542.1:382-1335(-)